MDRRYRMTAAMLCPTCGTEALAESARFCHACGSPLLGSETPAEYKQVTVLFADVVHSMDIAATVGPERLREIMTDLIDRASAVVQRYGGTVDKFTGDGIMAVFGAPVALEDHAVRACLAALGLQEEAKRLAVDVQERDGVDLQLRVGLNSGQVIAGEIGSGALGYTAVGEQVGMAQRMESVAPPGGVLLSESTARLVEEIAVLGEAQMVRIKGGGIPIPACCLLTMQAHRRLASRSETPLVGRQPETSTLAAILQRSMGGRGGVVGVLGPAGIGKSRMVREAAARAAARGVEVFWTYCESHASDIPFHVVSRLLRAATGLGELDGPAARAQVRARVPVADPQDLLLLDDLLGIADPDIALPKIDPDARRRRLTALVNTATLARAAPAVFVIEDAQWIDEVSESMLAAFLAEVPQSPVMVAITYRPDYRGGLARLAAQTVALAPLGDSEASALIAGLLGSDPSVCGLVMTIAERAAGNPFFAEEMVRDLAERGVLDGERGAYVCRTDVAEVSVPASLQATIAARIDRLNPSAKRAVSAAAVIGSRFGTDLLAALQIEPTLDEPVTAELMDQVGFDSRAEYVFRHPLIRTVAYESQLKSDRAELHRRVAAVIQERDPASVDENAPLIAEHLQAAGDMYAAYGWHMRAASWYATRDIAAAYLSWQRAARAADALPADDPGRTAMRIAPRAFLCGNAVRVHESAADRFEELRKLCAAAGDKASLAIGMAGLLMEHLLHGRVREASRVASEMMVLVESIGDVWLTMLLSATAIPTKMETMEPGGGADVLRWSQNVIELADGNPAFGSQLAAALATRGAHRWCFGSPGWRDDLLGAVAVAGETNPMAQARMVTIKYATAIYNGVLLADDRALRDIQEALRLAERSSDDLALGLARLTMGLALLHQDAPADRERGLRLLAQLRDMCLHRRFLMSELPVIEVWIAREKARSGDRDGALPLMRKALDELFGRGQLGYAISVTGVLVETLLDRGAESDVAETEAAIDRLAAAPTDERVALRDIWLLRLRALLARAHDDATAYAHFRDRYRDMAKTLGFEGHIEWAEAMP
jgi:class 3 adenylate cyclase